MSEYSNDESEYDDFISQAFNLCLKRLEEMEIIKKNFNANSVFLSSESCRNLANLFSDAILNVIQNYDLPEDELFDESENVQHEDLIMEMDSEENGIEDHGKFCVKIQVSRLKKNLLM